MFEFQDMVTSYICNFFFRSRSVSFSTRAILSVSGCVIALMSFTTLCETLLHWSGTLFGENNLNFAYLGELILTPILWLLGVSWEQTHTVRLQDSKCENIISNRNFLSTKNYPEKM